MTVVEAWHNALNSGDVETLVALVAPDVKIGGPRGTTSGAEVVREWFGRANVRFIPLQWFGGEYAVVVEQRGEWLDESGAVSSTATVGTKFVVGNDLITEISRYDDLQLALDAASLTLNDRVSPA